MSIEHGSIFPLDSRPYGFTYKEWTVRWWKWLCSIPRQINPAFDSTGEHMFCSQNEANVLFLCQTIEGIINAPLRKGIVYSSRAIFMPVINWISIMNLDGNTEEELAAIATRRMDVIKELKLKINETLLQDELMRYRIQSPFFYINLPEDNIFGIDSGDKKCISDGYWVFIMPQKQNLKISSFGSCSQGITKIGSKYELLMNENQLTVC